MRCYKLSNCFYLCQRRSPCVFHSTLKSICQPDKQKVPQKFQLMQSLGSHPSLPRLLLYSQLPERIRGPDIRYHVWAALVPHTLPMPRAAVPPSSRAVGLGKCWVPPFVPGLLCQDAQASPDLPAGLFTLCHQLPHRLQHLPKCCFPQVQPPTWLSSAPAASSHVLPQRDAGEPLSRNGSASLLSRQPLFAKKLPRGWKVLGGQKGKLGEIKHQERKKKAWPGLFLIILLWL